MKKFIIILLTIGCMQTSRAQLYHVTAELTGFENGTKFYLKDIMADKNIDSAILKNGKLTMQGKIGHVSPVWFCCSYRKEFYFTNLLLGAEQVRIQADVKDFPWFTRISGSKSQDVANILNVQTRQLWKDRDSIMKILYPLAFGKQSDSMRNVTKPMIKKVQFLDSVRESITAEFIVKHLNSDAALQELYYKKDEYKKEELNGLIDQINPVFKRSLFAKLLVDYQKVGRILKKGDQFHDFSAKDLLGNTYQLSSFKGKYILLDFVETYCAPCVEAASDLAILSKKYKELQVISFYVEQDAKIMQAGLDRDRPTWPAIWDGKGTQSEISLKYGVNGFPTFVLISPEGKIIMHSSGFSRDDNGKGNLERAVDLLLQKAK